MRFLLAVAAGLLAVGCSHAGTVSDDPRLAALDRVHPGGHIPSLEKHSMASMDALDPDTTPASATVKARPLVARNEVPADDVGGSELATSGSRSAPSSAADDAFDSPAPKAKKVAHAKKHKRAHH